MAATGLGDAPEVGTCTCNWVHIVVFVLYLLCFQPLTEEGKIKQLHQNVITMTYFAFELIRVLNQINKQAFNDLQMRIGNYDTVCINSVIIAYKLHVYSPCREGGGVKGRCFFPSFCIVILEFSGSSIVYRY